jgi:hypothetical protein
MAREDMMNELTGEESADTTTNTGTTELPPAGVGDPGTGTDTGDTTAAPGSETQKDNAEPKPDPRAGTKALLDSLSEPDPNAAARGPDGKFLPKAGEQPIDTSKPDPKSEVKPEAKPGTPKTAEQEAEDLIKEMGVKSERGQERIKQVFAKAKEAESKATQLEADITEFREMVVSTGMTAEEFGQTLEFGRLLKTGDEKSLRTALEMVDQQRELICKQLGIEAPGVDPLADFPELKKSVDQMEMSRAGALELAKYKRQEQSRQQVQQSQQQSQQEMQQFQQQLDAAQQAAAAYFVTRKDEADYPAKLQRIQQYFKDPAKVNEFISTFEPKQWFGQIKFMYDNMSVPAAPRVQQNQLARSSQMMQGTRQANTQASTTDRLMGHLDNMGI